MKNTGACTFGKISCERVHLGFMLVVVYKILHNIQTTYINQQTKSKVDIGAMIGGMKGDIRKWIGNSIPEGSIDSMIN